MKTERVFLQIAMGDLEAAKCLCDKKLFPQAVFYLQQVVEKAVKSLGIWTKVITDDEAREFVGHRSPKLYLKLFGEFASKLETMRIAFIRYPKLRELELLKEFEPDEFKGKLSDIEKLVNETEALSISSSMEKLQNIVAELRKLKEEFDANAIGQIAKLEINKEDRQSVQNWTSRFLDAFHTEKPDEIEQMKRELNRVFALPEFPILIKKLGEFIIEFSYCYLSLFYLSLVLSPHATRTRYPFIESNPMEIYTDELPLIQVFSVLLDSAAETLEVMERLYSELSIS